MADLARINIIFRSADGKLDNEQETKLDDFQRDIEYHVRCFAQEMGWTWEVNGD